MKLVRRAAIVIILLVIVAAGLLVVIVPKYKAMFMPNVKLPKGEKERYIYIPTGSTFKDLKGNLFAEGIFRDTASFAWAAQQMSYADNILPGRYLVKHNMSNRGLINMLRAGEQVPINISLNRLRFKEQLASKLGEDLETDSTAIIELLNDTTYLASLGATPVTIMGMFVSNTYQFNWNTSAEQAIERLVDEWEKVWADERRDKAAEVNLSPIEVMSLASIVQEETAKQDEAPKIAGVYLNRLKKDMLLQADPTLKYIRLLKNQDKQIYRLYNRDKVARSEYNTYRNKGLPPSPIILPEIWAIDAVLDAEEHDYIFFVAKDDFSGYHVFTKTYAEHQAYSRKYRRELNRRNIR